MHITHAALDDLHPDHRNARVHDLDAIEAAIADELLHPLVARWRSGRLVLVVGHGRRKVLRRMRERGAAPPKGCEDWQIPIVIADVDDARAARHLLGDNAASDHASWEGDALDALLAELRVDASDMLRAFGFLEPPALEASPPRIESTPEDEELDESDDAGGLFRERDDGTKEPVFTISITWPALERAHVLAALARGMRSTGATTYADLLMRLIEREESST